MLLFGEVHLRGKTANVILKECSLRKNIFLNLPLLTDVSLCKVKVSPKENSSTGQHGYNRTGRCNWNFYQEIYDHSDHSSWRQQLE